jgi:uncharacterized membrane protein
VVPRPADSAQPFAMIHRTLIPVAATGMLLVFLTFPVERDARSPRAMATWAAAAIGLVIGGLTVFVMMPLNDAIREWARSGPPPSWIETRQEWVALQGLRAILSTAAFLALVVATQLRGRRAG